MANSTKTNVKSPERTAKAKTKNGVSEIAKANAMTMTNVSAKTTSAKVRKLRNFNGDDWSKKIPGTVAQMTKSLLSPTRQQVPANMIIPANLTAVRVIGTIVRKHRDPHKHGEYAFTVIDSAGNLCNVHCNAPTAKKVYNSLPLHSCLTIAKPKLIFHNRSDNRYNFVLSDKANETFETSFGPLEDDPTIPYGRWNPMNGTHLPHFVATTAKQGRRADAIGSVSNFIYTQGSNPDDDEETQRRKSKCVFTMMGKHFPKTYTEVAIWGEQAIDLAHQYDQSDDPSFFAFIKNAGVHKREHAEDTTIVLSSEYNTKVTMLPTNDVRLRESKITVVEDEDADLSPLTDETEREGNRFTEEVFLYADRIDVRPLATNKHKREGGNGGTKTHASRVGEKFKPRNPFSDDEDDDDDDFAPPTDKSAKEDSDLEDDASQSESEPIDIEANSPKKGPSKEIIDVGDDEDDEGEAQPAAMASPKKRQPKPTKTSTPTRKPKPAARASPKTTLGKDGLKSPTTTATTTKRISAESAADRKGRKQTKRTRDVHE